MSLPIRIKPEADADVLEHAAFLGRSNPQVGRRFMQAALETYAFLAEFPGLGGFYMLDDPTIPAVRKWPVNGFSKYLIFYRDEGSVLEIVRVIHASRDVPRLLREMQ